MYSLMYIENVVLRFPDSTLCTTISIACKEAVSKVARNIDPTAKSPPILLPRL